MEEEYTQKELDRMAEELREYSSRLSKLFQISHGFETDPEKVSDYVEGDISYKDLIDDVDTLLQEAEESLDSAEPVTAENREEQLYRKYRRHGSIPEIPDSGRWRDFYSEHETVGNERGEELDYRSLQRVRNDTVLFLLNASEFDEEMENIIPEIGTEDAEIIEETLDTNDIEYTPALILRLQAEGLGRNEEAGNTSYCFFGHIG